MYILNKHLHFWTLHICITRQHSKELLQGITLLFYFRHYICTIKDLFWPVTLLLFIFTVGQTMVNLLSASSEFSQLWLVHFYDVGRN